MAWLSRSGSLAARTFRKGSSLTTLQARFAHESSLRYLVGVDGTEFGFNALRRAYDCSQNGDEIICLYLPPSLERFETELLMFGPSIGEADTKALWQELEKSQRSHIDEVSDKCLEIDATKNAGKSVDFKMKIGEPSASAKHDLVHACYDYKTDFLVLGSKGLAHSMRERIRKSATEKLGSIPDYCADNAPCSVIIVKESDYGSD